MDEADAIDPELIDLVVQLCTRIGMIMEDMCPVAINGSLEELEVRVAEVVRSIRTMASLADAAQALLLR